MPLISKVVSTAPEQSRVLTRSMRRSFEGKTCLPQTGGETEAEPESTEAEPEMYVAASAAPKVPRITNNLRGGGGAHFVGASRARKDAKCMQDDTSDFDSDMTIEGGSSPRRRSSKASSEGSYKSKPSAEALCQKAEEKANAVLRVVQKPGNLKGTCARDIREGMDSLLGIVREIATCTASSEVTRLKADNKRLRGQINKCMAELQGLKQLLAGLGHRLEPAEQERPMEAESNGVSRAELMQVMGVLQRDLLQDVGADSKNKGTNSEQLPIASRQFESQLLNGETQEKCPTNCIVRRVEYNVQLHR
ncbi:unnamed protein product [Chilo suppressalis]|uniref:Uncharacterized protein n=1 Tax=Chilo suppressalis TaxID=168631 RepID=A0ABN8B784_CHISP|nr:unnamed protein product [Chilo suppressalis]